VVAHGPAALPSDQRAVHPGQLYEWVRGQVPADAETVFIGGNGFRAVGVIAALEEDLGRPVLTANQVAFWQALRVTGARVPVVGYGQIFDRALPGT
jgi:maleate isomerase